MVIGVQNSLPGRIISTEQTVQEKECSGSISGLFAATYIHDQAIPANVWEVSHNLGKYPSVSIVDSAGNVVVGEVQYKTNNQIFIYFTSAFGGKAYLN
jgi:hypothetical protein